MRRRGRGVHSRLTKKRIRERVDRWRSVACTIYGDELVAGVVESLGVSLYRFSHDLDRGGALHLDWASELMAEYAYRDLLWNLRSIGKTAVLVLVGARVTLIPGEVT